MVKRYRMLALALLEPGPYTGRRSTAIAVQAIPLTTPTRYLVIGGHDRYWQAVTDGCAFVFCEIR